MYLPKWMKYVEYIRKNNLLFEESVEYLNKRIRSNADLRSARTALTIVFKMTEKELDKYIK